MRHLRRLLEEALYLARLGRKVDVVHRRDMLRASKIMQERAFKNPKITFVWNSMVDRIADQAAGKLTTVTLRNVKTGELVERAVDGLFVAIGHEPNTALFRGQLELLDNGYVKIAGGGALSRGDAPVTRARRGSR